MRGQAAPRPARRRSGFQRLAACLALLFCCAAFAATPAKKNPAWSDLTPEQQQTLKPLAGEWDTLDAPRRTKWLGIAKRYPAMTPTEQKRVQDRMAAWVKLTPDQRRAAREQYRKIGKLPPAKREVVSQQWAEYQQLPPEVKKNLAAENRKKADKLEPRKRTRTANNNKKPPVIPGPPAPPPPPSPASVIPTSAN
ncbi:MAG: DUF3106 domain-containing protein [Proteobacteria bacterium]|nr:DUF3106 domain-containing protein [Pseudomonadota bacterium]